MPSGPSVTTVPATTVTVTTRRRTGGHGSPSSSPNAPTTTLALPPQARVLALPATSTTAGASSSPVVSAPSQTVAGQRVVLVGSGFKAGSSVELVLETARPVKLANVKADQRGAFRAAVVMPSAKPGAHRIKVVGISLSGSRLALAASVSYGAGPGYLAADDSALASPALLTLSVVVPLATWLALEITGWRRRRTERTPSR
ncbi:MAG TPA: hypothetical protein VFN61_12715 [Acidimicrobiales bacterium]|nr:hypothetical protein [Acidimicrobiales bacterium]